jgi:hypothetical protein
MAAVLSPHPIPYEMPTATAITFLKAAQSSTPQMSVDVYVRKFSVAKISEKNLAVASFLLAQTAAEGTLRTTSSACVGPDKTAIL